MKSISEARADAGIGAVPPKTSIVDDQTNRIRVQIAELEGQIVGLTGALNKVLTPESPIAKLGAAGEAKAPSQSPLADELGCLAYQLGASNSALRELIARIEI